MRDIHYLYTSFEGRISRQTYWWGASLLLLAQTLLTLGLARMAGLNYADFANAGRKAGFVNLVVVAFFFWPSLALAAKRLHDRDLPAWWAALLHVLMFLFYADIAVGRPLIRDKTQALVSLWPAALMVLLGLWLVVEMVLLRGTRGPNRFGLDPAGSAPAAVAPPSPAA